MNTGAGPGTVTRALLSDSESYQERRCMDGTDSKSGRDRNPLCGDCGVEGG